MKYFEKYVSNTYAGSANQHFFTMDDGEIRTGRVFYKISVGGEYNYSLLFSNIMDSTYDDGSVSHKNLICSQWKIHSARVGISKSIPAGKEMCELTVADKGEGKKADIIVGDFKGLSFDGRAEKLVMPGEFFTSDALKLNFDKGDYLCLEITFSGKMIPYHEESLLPVFVKDGEQWKYSRQMPFAAMIGCDRKVEKRVVYLGDSITQGIGAGYNTYMHWNAQLSEMLDRDYSYWNLGIGYARAEDAATDGAWLYKVKHSDTVVVCLGVNDLMQKQGGAAQIKADLKTIVSILKKEGKYVILQTVPPFDYSGEKIDEWKDINSYIKTVLAKEADFVFDNVKILCESEQVPYMAKFGGHPDERGCSAWAKAFYEEIKDII